MKDRLEVSETQREQFRKEGYFILERVLPDHFLELLRGECQHFIDAKDAEMSAQGDEQQGITQKGKRYFIANCFRQQPRLRRFLFSELMADVCRATQRTCSGSSTWSRGQVEPASAGTRIPAMWAIPTTSGT